METWITTVFDHLDWMIVFAMGLTLGLLTSLVSDRPARDSSLGEQSQPVPKTTPAETSTPELIPLFQGGSNSLVAIANSRVVVQLSKSGAVRIIWRWVRSQALPP